MSGILSKFVKIYNKIWYQIFLFLVKCFTSFDTKAQVYPYCFIGPLIQQRNDLRPWRNLKMNFDQDFCFELVWTLVRRTQPSGPLCLWQCLHISSIYAPWNILKMNECYRKEVKFSKVIWWWGKTWLWWETEIW